MSVRLRMVDAQVDFLALREEDVRNIPKLVLVAVQSAVFDSIHTHIVNMISAGIEHTDEV